MHRMLYYPEMKFDETELDFGTIEQGTNVRSILSPLLIQGKLLCDYKCFKLLWLYSSYDRLKKPIAPGETGEMLGEI